MVWYADGSIQVAANGQVATGTGTAFLKNVRIGDGLTIAGSASMHEVTNIASDTQLTFSPPFTGAAGSGKQYRIAPIQGYVKEAADLLRALTQNLGSFANNANLTALAAAVGAANKGLMFTGPGAIGTFDLTAQARSFLAAQTLAAQQAALGLVLQSSITDTSASVMRVGGFGWGQVAGSNNTITDADSILPNGLYRIASTTTGTMLGTAIGQMIHAEQGAGYAVQLAMRTQSPPAMHMRVKTNNVWGAPVQLWDTGNLIKQANASDTTAGAVLINGAYGLGASAAPAPSSIDDLSAIQFFRGGAANGSPFGSTGATGIHLQESPAYGWQLIGANGGANQSLKWRIRSAANVWAPFRDIWDTNNLVKQAAPYSQTPGAVLLNGSFGLGGFDANSRVTNLNDTTYAYNGFLTTANSPTGYPNSGRGGVINLGYSEGERGQLILDPPTGNLFMRIRYSGTAGVWQSPVQFWHTGNLTPNKLEDRTLSTLPAAGANKGQMFLCTNTPRGNRPVYSDGSNWLKIEDNTLATAA